MLGKTLRLPILLTGLALLFHAGSSGAKYNLVGRDDEIAAMKVVVDKGISCISSPIKKQIPICTFENSFHCVESVFLDEVQQPVFKPPISPIARLGSVGGSGSECKPIGGSCVIDPHCCNEKCRPSPIAGRCVE